jgi:hypothetical protein
MKKLFLKNNMEFSCELLVNQQVICLYDYEGNRIANIGKTVTVMLARSLKHYELFAIAEIAENFNHYFNNLNQ